MWLAPEPPGELRRANLLWPAWVYAVYAPRVTARPGPSLDAFQRATLRLYRAGVRDPVQVAAHLYLDRRLALYIDAGLRTAGLCTDRREVTAKGEAALDSDDPGLGPVSKGFVFQDPETSDLWPRVVKQLEFSDVSGGLGRARVDIGTAGRPQSVLATRVKTDVSIPRGRPSAEQVLRAIRGHQQDALRAADHAEAPSADGDDPDDLGRVTIDPEPIAVWLGVVVTRSPSAAEWEVMDPLGLGRSPFTHRLIERRVDGHQELRQALAGLAKAGGPADERADRLEARHDLDELLDGDLTSAPEVREALVDLLIADARATRRRSQTEHAAMIGTAVRALERALAGLLPQTGDDAVAADLSGAAEFDGALLQAHAQALGFSTLPLAMRDVPATLIREALASRSGPLRALVAANVLSAARDAGHALHHAANADPGLLVRLDDLVTLRDEQARGGLPPSDQDPSAEDVLMWVQALYPAYPTTAKKAA